MLIPPDQLLVFALASLALLLIPGPAVLYIVTRSASQGRAAGVASVLGIQCGGMVHVLMATLGLSAILLSSALAYNVVKYAGAAYLAYLGLRTWLSREPIELGALDRQPLRRIFLQGFVVNALNPKTALFFFAFLPQFVDPARGAVSLQFLLLGLVFITLATFSDGGYALLSSTLGGWLRRKSIEPRFALGQRLVTGGIYIGLGVTAALTGHKHQ
ncbi:LysE family translocator [Meiothermus sp.]|uniref:LysE family translocator n=1 Tax=Meiothermus sp. TaxID=1955249 RepID=UPI0021DF4169|nr:LysE family translocator [Meiothermus sp.]GIW35703.1 MAG: RhtB family transporter [Meiothermus sp.]